MNTYEEDFGVYQRGEDEIADTYDTPEEFANALRVYISKTHNN